MLSVKCRLAGAKVQCTRVPRLAVIVPAGPLHAPCPQAISSLTSGGKSTRNTLKCTCE